MKRPVILNRKRGTYRRRLGVNGNNSIQFKIYSFHSIKNIYVFKRYYKCKKERNKKEIASINS